MTFIFGFVAGSLFWVPSAIVLLYLYGQSKWPAFTETLKGEARNSFARGKREGIACAMHTFGFSEIASLSDDEKLVFAKLAADLEAEDDDEWATRH